MVSYIDCWLIWWRQILPAFHLHITQQLLAEMPLFAIIAKCMQGLPNACKHCYMHASIATCMQGLLNACKDCEMHASIATCMQALLDSCKDC